MIRNFYRPATADEALKLFKAGGIFLAGGTELNRGRRGDDALPGLPGGADESNIERDLVYLEGLGLRGIHSQGDSLFIGACATLQELADNPGLPGWLREAAWLIPSRNIRNMATLGGNVAAGRSNSVILPGLIAAGGLLHLAGGTIIPAEDYLKDPEGGLILEIEMPDEAAAGYPGVCRIAWEARSRLAVPVVNAGVYLEMTSGGSGAAEAVIRNPRITAGCGCAGKQPGRLTGLEQNLAGKPIPLREELILLAEEAVEPESDIHGSAAYRSRVNGVRIADLILECAEALL